MSELLQVLALVAAGALVVLVAGAAVYSVWRSGEDREP